MTERGEKPKKTERAQREKKTAGEGKGVQQPVRGEKTGGNRPKSPPGNTLATEKNNAEGKERFGWQKGWSLVNGTTTNTGASWTYNPKNSL